MIVEIVVPMDVPSMNGCSGCTFRFKMEVPLVVPIVITIDETE
jgi:hypothetical protein